MTEYLRIFKNWRICVIAILFAVGAALLACDGDDPRLLVVSKIAGILMLYICGALTGQWREKITELDVFDVKEEDDD